MMVQTLNTMLMPSLFCILPTQRVTEYKCVNTVLYTALELEKSCLKSHHLTQIQIRPESWDGKPNNFYYQPLYCLRIIALQNVFSIMLVYAKQYAMLSVVRRASAWALRVFDTVMVLTANSSSR